MLGNTPLVAILPVVDLARAKAFYSGTLGLKQLEESESDVIHQAGAGTMLNIYLRPSPTTADHTAVGFMVDDLKAIMTGLRAREVKFEEYDIPEMDLKTVDGVATIGKETAAWFKDPDGNILSVSRRG